MKVNNDRSRFISSALIRVITSNGHLVTIIKEQRSADRNDHKALL